MFRPISRRAVLRGVGAAIALPWLEAMTPALSFGAPATPTGPTKRMAFIYVPNGVNIEEWRVKGAGTDFAFSPTRKTLEPHKQDLLVLSGLTADKARPHGDGPGDHARAMAAYLTSSQPKKTSGANIQVGVSVDQVAAARIGNNTRFPSLEI